MVARHQPGIDQQLFVVFRFQLAQQRIAAARRVTNSETSDRILIEPAILEIRPRCFPFRRSFELLHEKSLRLAVHFHQHRTLLILFPLLRRALFLPRNGDPAFLRDHLHGLGKFALLHVHHEVVHVAALATPEAVENLFDGRDREGWSLFLVKRAKPAEVFPRFLQADVFADNANNVRLLLYLVRK